MVTRIVIDDEEGAKAVAVAGKMHEGKTLEEAEEAVKEGDDYAKVKRVFVIKNCGGDIEIKTPDISGNTL